MSALSIGENKITEKLSSELKIKIWDSKKNECIKPWLSTISYGKNKDRAYGETGINSKTYELTKVNIDVITPAPIRAGAITSILIENALEAAGYEQTAY